MAGGLASQVIEPTASASPEWVQRLVNWGGTAWSYHPIQARRRQRLDPDRHRRLAHRRATRALVQARRGGQRRLGPGRLGVRGVVRRDLRAGPELADRGAGRRSPLRGRGGAHRAAGRRLAQPAARAAAAGGLGLFFLGMALLQAWPGRGFWQGTLDGKPGTLAGMVQSMSGTSQPHFLSSLLSGFGSFDASNGFAVNLVVVIALAAMGVIFLTGRPRLVRYAAGFGIVFCLADWVLVQDSRLPGRSRDRPEQHDPDGPAVLGRLPRPGACAARGHSAARGGGRDGWVEAATTAGGAGRRASVRAGPVGRGGCGAGGDLARGGADGLGGGEPDRGPDPGPGHRRATARPSTRRRSASRSPTRTGGRSRWPACAARSC